MAEAARRRGATLLLLAPSLALLACVFVAPLAAFMEYSFHRFRRGRLTPDYNLDTYRRFLFDDYYHVIILDTLRVATSVTLLALAIGYPLAYAMWKIRRPALQRWLGLLIFSPILVSVVVRSYGWTVLLSDQGPVNWTLRNLGLASEPVPLVFNLTGVLIALTHVFLPFVVFPIFTSLSRLDPSLREAASDLGAGWWMTFRRITLPLSLPGVVAGAQICFVLSLGAFVTPALLGGGRVLVLPLQVYAATAEVNWPVAAVGGLVLLLAALLAVIGFNRLTRYSEVR
jgi:putative spermidine/putrescine transport system permease protein